MRRSGQPWRQWRVPDSRFHWDFGSFIADFEGSEACSEQLRSFPSWRDSKVVFITPDNSTEAVRRAAIADGKTYLMTTYGIRRGFLLLRPHEVPADEIEYAATLDGMDRYGHQLDLKAVADLGHIGLLVTGGSAVSFDGLRIGKGHGYFDLEWALLSELGSTDESTEIVDIVHDCQVVDIEVQAAAHDVRVDWILTPTRAIRVEGPPRPSGRVRWELIAGTEFEHIPPVRRAGGPPGPRCTWPSARSRIRRERRIVMDAQTAKSPSGRSPPTNCS